MLELPVKLAVASQEGKAVSEHFGHAKRFWIYEVNTEGCRLLEQREVDHYCLGNSANQGALSGIMEAIQDCHAVFVAKIGDSPAEKLRAIGVQAVSNYAWEAIDESLLDYVQRTQKGEALP